MLKLSKKSGWGMNEDLGCIEATDELWQEVIEASLFSVVYYIALDINALVTYRKPRVTRGFTTTPGHCLPSSGKHVQIPLPLGGPSLSLETGL